MEYPLFNVFINSHFETEDLKFRCVFDSEKIHVSNNIDVLTHIVKVKNNKFLSQSIFFPDKNSNQLKDISLLLSVAQGTHIFFKNQNLGRVSNYRKKYFDLFLPSEIGDFLDWSLKKISKMKKSRLNIIKNSLLIFYEAKYLLFYDGLRDILMMNCFEFLIGAIYRQDNAYSENNLKMQRSYKHIIEKFNYEQYINDRLKKEIRPRKLFEFKKEKNVPKIESFIRQFEKMRNWIAHGKQHKKPKFENSPSDSEFAFLYRLESFIRVIFIDLIYGKDYARKFDVLYQLILEMNICPTFESEFSRLKFYDSEKYTLICNK